MLTLTLSLQWILHQMDPGVILPQPHKGTCSAPERYLNNSTSSSSSMPVNAATTAALYSHKAMCTSVLTLLSALTVQNYVHSSTDVAVCIQHITVQSYMHSSIGTANAKLCA